MSLNLTEEQVQATTIDGFKKMGYAVLQTTHRVKLATCPRCKHKHPSRGDYGASKGVPDLLVSHPRWPAHCWLAIEMKRPGKWTYSSDEQKELCECGRVAVATSWDEALAVLRRFEAEVVNAIAS